MGGGDLNMKKSWHPALLVNQERVWKAQKQANEEKKALQQLRKEREEERQLAELQRMQEAATGKKRTEKLDWMYAAPSAEDGAMGGRMSERELEDYLLGKKRVDEVLAAGDKNIGNSHREFVAVQNANTARDTAAKIREDPVLAMKKAEQAAIAALMNRPDIRRQLKAAKKEREGGDDKEERRARRRAEKEERRRERHERRERRGDYDRSPRSDYSDDRRERDDRRAGRDYDDRRRDDRGYGRADRDDRDYRRDDRDRDYRRDDRDRRPRSRSPRRDRDDSHDRRHESSRSDERRSNGHSDRRPSPKRERESPKRERYDSRDAHHGNGHGSGPSNGRSNGHSSGSHSAHSRNSDERYDNRARDDRPPRRASPERKPYVKSEPAAPAQDDRAARLAAMSSNAASLNAERTEKLARRAIEEKAEEARDEKARSRYHRDEAAGLFMKHQEQMSGQIGLAESLQRRGGKGLLRDI
ncbi:RNA-splicing factor [Vanrija albida]|uniref:RNA-splicing factor n=1 Tax=Vanrija albida TaxID=181172 RepID=A0ABR3QE02_9TREE